MIENGMLGSHGKFYILTINPHHPNPSPTFTDPTVTHKHVFLSILATLVYPLSPEGHFIYPSSSVITITTLPAHAMDLIPIPKTLCSHIETY